jgi:hypothetical protein
MRNNFAPQLNYNPLAIAQLGIGALQGIIGGISAKANQKKLENMQSPIYKQNQGILDYYNTALQRYGVSPTDSAMYKRQTRDIDRGVSGAIGNLNDRRSGTAGASSILRASNDARLNANVAAETERNNRFGVLGNATNMKVNEDDKAFQQNEIAPFERKYNLLSMKAGANNQTTNSGLSNIFGGLQNMYNSNMLKKYYGG